MLAPAGADKRGSKAPFPLVENAGKRPFTREYPPELWREPGLTESTELSLQTKILRPVGKKER